jgi:hypothetical protein
MATQLVFLLSITLPLLLACSWAVAALGFPPFSGILFAFAPIVAHHPAMFTSLLSSLTLLFISRQFCRWRRRRPPVGLTRSKIGKSQHVIMRILSALFHAWLTLLCLAYVTRTSHDLLFGVQDASLSSHHASRASLIAFRNVLAMPDSHKHHSRTLLDGHIEPMLSHTLRCVLNNRLSLYQGDYSGRTVMNYPVTATKLSFTHHPSVDQQPAESAPLSLSVHHVARCLHHYFAHTCRKANTYVNNFFPSSCNALHQSVATPRSLAAHTHSPAQWINNMFTSCTSLPASNISGIVHSNPVAASLRLPNADRRFMGIIPALCISARKLQHYLWTAKAGWATPAAASARWAWAAAWGDSVQLGRVHAKAASGQVCDPAPASGIMFAHMSEEHTVVSRVVAHLCSVVAPWVQLSVQYVVTVCSSYPVAVIVCVLSLLSVEIVYWLLRWASSHGRAIADAMAEIAAAPETHHMALHFQLYRYTAGRQHRSRRVVKRPGRPLRLRDQYSDLTIWQLRAFAILLVTLTVGYVYMAVAMATRIHANMEQTRPVVEPVRPCWPLPSAGLGTGVVTCGFPTAKTDHGAFPTWEQGGAFAIPNAFPSLEELRGGCPLPVAPGRRMSSTRVGKKLTGAGSTPVDCIRLPSVRGYPDMGIAVPA